MLPAESFKSLQEGHYFRILAANDQPYEWHFAYKEIPGEDFDVFFCIDLDCELFGVVEIELREIEDDCCVKCSSRIPKSTVFFFFQAI